MKRFHKNIKTYLGLAVLLFAASCKPSIDTDINSGTAQDVNFSKYIAIGNSLSAGYADGGLSLKGQQNAFPNLIAEQMKKLGGGEFYSPYFPEANYNGSGYLYVKALVNGRPQLDTVKTNLAIRGLSPNKTPLYIKYTGPINNFGVPGMRLDMAFAAGVGSALGNPYFERLLADDVAATTKYVDFVSNQNHTFFSFSLGNNDVLGYATNGGVTTGPTNSLISEQLFTTLYSNFIAALTKDGQKGVVATIPDVTAVPYFTTVKRADLIAAVNAALKAQGQPNIKDLYIATKTGPRAATDNDLFVLPFSSLAGSLLGKPNADRFPYGLTTKNPIEDKYVLDESETKEVQNRVVALNKAITTIADSKNLAVADIYSFLNKIKTGYKVNGITVSNQYVTGNAFSLDGVHLTPMGYAIMANVFIDAINAKYSTKLGTVNVVQYGGVALP